MATKTTHTGYYVLLLKTFISFGLKNASAAIFGGYLLAIMLVTRFYYPDIFLHRYDFIFIAAIFFQLTLLALKFETPKEALVIFIFHLIATGMELFKTSDTIQSWYYPEEYTFGIGNVPLFTGFMYSAVGSYIVRSFKVFDLKFSGYPSTVFTLLISISIYLNFFSHHYMIDLRWPIIALILFYFHPTKIHYRTLKAYHRMSLVFGWFLVALFIWLAENVATFTNIWLYPNQTNGWQPVSFGKMSSWFLLIALSFILVSFIHKTSIRSTIKNMSSKRGMIGLDVF